MWLPYFNAEIFRILRAVYFRTLYQQGDRSKRQIRRFCQWLEKTHPDKFNPALLALKPKLESPIKEEDLETEEEEVAVDAMEVEAEVEAESPDENEGDNSDSSDSNVDATTRRKSGVKASTRTNLRKSGTNLVNSNTDDKSKQAGQSVKLKPSYKPPSSRVRPLPNVIVPPPCAAPVPVKIEVPKPKLIAKRVNKPLEKAVAVPKQQIQPQLLHLQVQQPTAIRTYGSKPKQIPVQDESISNISIVTQSDQTQNVLTPILTSDVNSIVNLVTSQTPSTSAPHSATLTVPSPMASQQPRHVLIARSNQHIVGQQSVQAVMNQKPILFRNINPTRAQQGQGQTMIQTSTGLHIPTSTIQLVGGPGQSLAFVNVRGGLGQTAVIRASNLPQNLTGSQVVRLLQQQGIILQQNLGTTVQGGIQSGGGGTSIPLTVRLPVSVQTPSSTPNSASAAVCSTASAIVAANTTAVRLAARAGVGQTTQFQVLTTGGRPMTPVSIGSTGNNTLTATARSGPIATTAVATVRNVRPGTMASGVRTATFTASQLRNALASGTQVLRSTLSAGGLQTIRTGTQINASHVRAIQIPSTIAGGQPRTVLTTTNAPRTASGMLKPVTIATSGMRQLNAVRATVAGPGTTGIFIVYNIRCGFNA